VEAAPGVVVFAATWGRPTAGPDPLVDGLHQWTSTLNRKKPASLLALDATANSLSAASVLAWTRGLAAGGIVAGGNLVRSAGFETVVDRIRSGNYEVLFWIDGVENRYSELLVRALQDRGDRRLIVLASRQSVIADLADLLLPVAEPGYDEGGDFWRLDEVPLRLDPLFAPLRPTASTILAALAGQWAPAQTESSVSAASP
jgi:formylmethanofuran dehydrogenase subunit B